MKNKVNQKCIIEDWEGNVNEPLVSILCDTFNHENYIREALDGFLSQKTTFAFEIIVHDDASTDQTAIIVKEYADQYPLIIKPIFQKENQYSKKVNFWSDLTFPKAQGEYIALCEGDDYWTDPFKLQKQVDFLEDNSDYVITWTDYVSKREDKMVLNDFDISLPKLYTIDFDTIFTPYCTLTLTCVFRKDAVDIQRYKQLKYSKDNTLYALALRNGKGMYLNFRSAVYRIHSGGVYSLKSTFFKSYSSYLNVKEIYDTIPQARTKNIQNVYESLFRESAFEALKLSCIEGQRDDLGNNVIDEFFKSSSFRLKIKFIRRYVKYSLFKSKYKYK
jgi:glycosyltransferase involved in cell wall biosynthesis